MEAILTTPVGILFRLWLAILVTFVIHELGHGLVGHLVGAKISGIKLTPVALGPKFQSDLTSNNQYFWSALGGPLTTGVFLILQLLPISSSILRLIGILGLSINALMLLPAGFFDGSKLLLFFLEGRPIVRYWRSILIITTLVSVLFLAYSSSAHLAGLLTAILVIDLFFGYQEVRKGAGKTEPPFMHSNWTAGWPHFTAYSLTLTATWLGFWYFGGVDGIIAAIESLTTLPW